MTTVEPSAQAEEPATSYAPAKERPLTHVGALLVFDGPLTRGEVLRTVARATRSHPELRSRPARLPLAADLLAWSADTDFHIARHVRAVDAGEALERVVSALWSQALPAGRPPWQVDLLSGPDDQGAALLVRGHAALAPGGDGAALARLLLAPSETATPPPDDEAQPRPARGSAVPALLRAAIALAERGARSSRGLAAEVRSLLRPGVALERTRGLGRALESAGTLLSSPAPETPWNRALGPERALSWLTLSCEALRGVAERLGGDWLDAWLTVVADALGRLLRGSGRDTSGLTLLAYLPAAGLAPADRRVPSGPLLVGLPAGERDTGARADAVRRSRRDPVAAARGQGLAQLAALSDRLLEPFKSLLGSLCYQATNVVVALYATPPEPIVVAGRKATLVVPLVSLPWHVGIALAACVTGDVLVVGVTVDASLSCAGTVTRALRDAYVDLATSSGVTAFP